MTAASINASYEGAFFGIANNDLRDGTLTYPHDLKMGMVELADTTDAADTVTIDMFQQFGMNVLLGLKGWVHTTNESVITTENSTCTVNEGKVTITVEAGSNNDKRIYLLVGI